MFFTGDLKRDKSLLSNRNKIKNIMLKSKDYEGDIQKVKVLLKAFDMDIVQWMMSGGFEHTFIEQVDYLNQLETGGLSAQEAESAFNEWKQIIEEVYDRKVTIKESITETPIASAGTVMDDEVVFDSEISYLNPVRPKGNMGIYIPCGFGNTDRGYYIKGIERKLRCHHKDENIYALVYNMLIRNSAIGPKDIPDFMYDDSVPYVLDYKSIYRLATIVLLLIRHNYITSKVVHVRFPDKTIMNQAIKLINGYASLFSKLIKCEYEDLVVKNDADGLALDIDGNETEGVFVVNNNGFRSAAREIWYGTMINYQLGDNDLPTLEYLLSQISPYRKFSEGQFDTLCNMMSTQEHAVCIMPTGSGKSLIYYMASVLQPLPLLVVSPTDILIDDQIRNLREIHHIDNVSHLLLTSENSFEDFAIPCSLNYLTPTTLQCKNMLSKFYHINNGTGFIGMREVKLANGPLVSYVVLDEIHCMSNWGHDFRPEYLMLSYQLKRFLDRIPFRGFTATANYTVVEDIQKQLSIPQENFFSPIAFDKYNVSYHFYEAKDTDQMYELLSLITDELIANKQRTLIFTKNDDISVKVADSVGPEADVFTQDLPSAYHHFVDEKCSILVASEDLGVGINFPNIRSIIHFGMPLSKNEYVQEVGRAGRFNEHVDSYVIYLAADKNNIPEGVLQRDIDVDMIPDLVNSYSNDYSEIYRRLTNGFTTKDNLEKQLIQLYHQLDYHKKALFLETYLPENARNKKQLLFMLYSTGYVNNWYTRECFKDTGATSIYIDITVNNHYDYIKDSGKMFRRMYEHLRDYLAFMGNDRNSISGMNRVKTPEDILNVYINWYFSRFLYHQNEEFLDMYEFFVNNRTSDDDSITGELKDYFVLPFAKLKTDEIYYRSLSIPEIRDKGMVGINSETLANLERINSNRYSYKIDFLLFIGRYRMNNRCELNRLTRILQSVSKEEDRSLIIRSLPLIYGCGKTESKLELFRFVLNNKRLLAMSYKEFFDIAYDHCDKDLMYYGVMAKSINPCFQKRSS